MKKLLKCFGLVILLVGLIGILWGFIKSNRVIPELGDTDNVQIVYTDFSKAAFYFVYSDGEISAPYRIILKIFDETGKKVSPKFGGLSNITWSPDGEYLALLAYPHIPTSGIPYLISTSGEIFTCKADNLPVTDGRVWIIQEKKVISPGRSGNDKKPDVILIFDFETCQIEDVLYEALENELLVEATLSTKGWLAISYRNPSSTILGIKIIDPVGNEYLIPRGETPSWSADGEKLAFVINEVGLYYSDKTGNNLTLVEEGIFSEYGYPTWSPDGEWIAYSDCCFGPDDFVIYKRNIYTYKKVIISENGSSPNWRWNISN